LPTADYSARLPDCKIENVVHKVVVRPSRLLFIQQAGRLHHKQSSKDHQRHRKLKFMTPHAR
jgi:hypothetical protein